jgi:hypothetical protein
MSLVMSFICGRLYAAKIVVSLPSSLAWIPVASNDSSAGIIIS